MECRFFVIRQRETDPVEVYPFEARSDAETFHEAANLQWSDVWLTEALAGPGLAPAPDRGRLINAKATAGARLVEAREAAARARGIVEQERARVRLLHAERDYEAATLELAAVERSTS